MLDSNSVRKGSNVVVRKAGSDVVKQQVSDVHVKQYDCSSRARTLFPLRPMPLFSMKGF